MILINQHDDMESQTASRNAEIVRDFFERRWNEGDIPADMVAEEYLVTVGFADKKLALC